MFRHAGVKTLSIRKYEAFAISDKIVLPGQAIGKVRTYTKTDHNPSRRIRTNWSDNDYSGPCQWMLEFLEAGEMKRVAEYDKKRAENK